MKKLVFASVMALASLSLVYAPTLRAQDSGTITIKDPAEYNAYQMATTQSDPKAKAAAAESFLQTYPQSVVKKAVLDMLVDTYQGLGDADKALSAAGRLLQLDPSNMKAIFLSVVIKKSQCQKTSDAQTCDDAAALAQKGLTVPKPAAIADDDWKKQTAATYPIYHSATALDDALSKKDFKAAISEYRTELMLYPPEQTQSGPGLVDTLNLAEAYTKPDAKDLVQAVWFYCRAWNFAPAAYKGQIEPKIEYYYKKYHGALDGLDGIKTQAAATVFPPGTFVIPPAPTPADLAHKALVETPDPMTLNLEDKEFILANGVKEDADKLWALLKDKVSPVPGIVIEASASVIKMAVTQDAKDTKTADFIVNLKKPLEDKDIPAVGFEFKLQPDAELDGTYDSYTQVPATATMAQTAQIVLKDAFVQPEKKKTAPVHKPAAGHKPAAH
jgi:tetratricopeptide (TPR) repeat protein